MNKKSLLVLVSLLCTASSTRPAAVTTALNDSLIQSQIFLHYTLAASLVALAALTIADTFNNWKKSEKYQQESEKIKAEYAAQDALNKKIAFEKALAAKAAIEQAMQKGDYKAATEIKTY